MKVVFVVGLPGSGKTTFLNTVIADDAFIIDDIESVNQTPEDSDCINIIFISDVHFCNSLILEYAIETLRFKYDPFEYDIIYFENDPEKCLKNVKHRNDGRKVEYTIRELSRIYSPPKTAMKIWTND